MRSDRYTRDWCCDLVVWLALALAIAAVLVCSPALGADQPPPATPHQMQLPVEVRAWYRNPDGSCVQCSIGMCGIWQNVPAAYTLLWHSDHGGPVRGGSGPSRVESYAAARNIAIFNVTGSGTFDWMHWAARTGRFAAIGAGGRHFQTLYAWDDRGTPQHEDDTIYVCNNNSTGRVDAYTWDAFQRLHLASGRWIVILDYPPAPRVPEY